MVFEGLIAVLEAPRCKMLCMNASISMVLTIKKGFVSAMVWCANAFYLDLQT